MKKQLLISLLIFVNGLVHSQDSEQILLCNDSCDSLYKQKEIQSRDLFYNLPSIENSDGDYIFRSWAGNSCVEIVKKNQTINGYIHFAAQKFSRNKSSKKKFTKTYSLDKKITEELYTKILSYSFKRRVHQSNKCPIVHLFILKTKFDIKVYSTDVPKLKTEIFNIIPMNDFLNQFEKEIPFKKFVEYELLWIEDMNFYQKKRNGL